MSWIIEAFRNGAVDRKDTETGKKKNIARRNLETIEKERLKETEYRRLEEFAVPIETIMTELREAGFGVRGPIRGEVTLTPYLELSWQLSHKSFGSDLAIELIGHKKKTNYYVYGQGESWFSIEGKVEKLIGVDQVKNNIFEWIRKNSANI